MKLVHNQNSCDFAFGTSRGALGPDALEQQLDKEFRPDAVKNV
jgi:hypothetical protein